jgi:hypothetical protein
MKTYSTLQVTKILGVGPDTLYRWMHEGKVPTPPLKTFAGMTVRLWSESDLEKAKKYKSEHYWGKGTKRNRKKRRK